MSTCAESSARSPPDPRDDFLSVFIDDQVRRAGMLPLEYVITEATTLLFGGLVTTQHMFTNTMFLLLEHPARCSACWMIRD